MFENEDLDRRWQDELAAERPGETGGGWRNPPYVVRVALVAEVFTMPGVLAGLMASLFLIGLCNPAVAAAVGGILFGAFGAWMEASG
jgi:hypothetical protein